MSELSAPRARLLLKNVLLLGWALVSLLFMGCTNTGVPNPDTSARTDIAAAGAEAEFADPSEPSDPLGAEPAATEAPKRKGTRVVGGLPPIRRADLVSGLTIPGAQRFFLGGGQPSSFFCDVENQGQTEVLLSSTRGSGATVIIRLHPGDSASHRFQPTEAAIIANLSPLEPAKLRVRVWGDTNLDMRYEPDQP